jgi:hypothetical protein
MVLGSCTSVVVSRDLVLEFGGDIVIFAPLVGPY